MWQPDVHEAQKQEKAYEEKGRQGECRDQFKAEAKSIACKALCGQQRKDLDIEINIDEVDKAVEEGRPSYPIEARNRAEALTVGEEDLEETRGHRHVRCDMLLHDLVSLRQQSSHPTCPKARDELRLPHTKIDEDAHRQQNRNDRDENCHSDNGIAHNDILAVALVIAWFAQTMRSVPVWIAATAKNSRMSLSAAAFPVDESHRTVSLLAAAEAAATVRPTRTGKGFC